MTLTRLSGAKSWRDPLVSQLLGESVASSPLAKARWYEAKEVAQLPLIRKKQIQAVKQYASVLFLAPELTGLLMDLNVPKGSFRHVSEFMTCRGGVYTAATGLPFPRPIPSRDHFMDTWKELVKPLAPDGEEARALFLAWEELGPLLAYAPEDDEWQAVVATRDLLRDLYSDTPPRADLRAAEVARAYRLHCCKAACQSNYLFYLEEDVTLVWVMRRGLGSVWARCAPMPLSASTPFSSGPTTTTRPAGRECRGLPH